jgi:hypothetical protein
VGKALYKEEYSIKFYICCRKDKNAMSTHLRYLGEANKLPL